MTPPPESQPRPTTHVTAAAATLAGGTLGPLSAPRITAIERLSAVDTVRARITMAVNLGLIMPGERLPGADEMAAAFGVSRASILRGLTALQTEGVVERRSGRYGGTFVRAGEHHDADVAVGSFTEDDPTVHSLIDERAILESGFAGIAASARTLEDLARLESLVDRMDTTESWAEFRNMDRDFHRIIAEAARVPLALELFSSINHQLDPYFLPYNMELLHNSNHEHRDILAALTHEDAQLASRLVFEHVRELHESMYVGLTATSSEAPSA